MKNICFAYFCNLKKKINYFFQELPPQTCVEMITAFGWGPDETGNMWPLLVNRGSQMDTCYVNLNVLHNALHAHGPIIGDSILPYFPIELEVEIMGNTINGLKVLSHSFQSAFEENVLFQSETKGLSVHQLVDNEDELFNTPFEPLFDQNDNSSDYVDSEESALEISVEQDSELENADIVDGAKVNDPKEADEENEQ